jgi:Protein of unknown function (DUF3311)
MRTTLGRWIFWVFLIAYTVALLFPGVMPFNHIQPFVLGMPFVLFWYAVWVAAGVVALFLVDRIEARARRER